MTLVSKITIFTDGACKGNPGRGGWAAILHINGTQHIEKGSELHTTNNRMELTAAIKGLVAAPSDKEVTIYSDSAYLVNTMTRNWKRNANQDLWERLDNLCKDRKVTWKWVRGHNGTPGNELADRIASREAGLFQQPLTDEAEKPPHPPSSPSRRPTGSRATSSSNAFQRTRRPRP
jgi:ribonuclease HI